MGSFSHHLLQLATPPNGFLPCMKACAETACGTRVYYLTHSVERCRLWQPHHDPSLGTRYKLRASWKLKSCLELPCRIRTSSNSLSASETLHLELPQVPTESADVSLATIWLHTKHLSTPWIVPTQSFNMASNCADDVRARTSTPQHLTEVANC